jgi:hypothetical protein
MGKKRMDDWEPDPAERLIVFGVLVVVAIAAIAVFAVLLLVG